MTTRTQTYTRRRTTTFRGASTTYTRTITSKLTSRFTSYARVTETEYYPYTQTQTQTQTEYYPEIETEYPSSPSNNSPPSPAYIAIGAASGFLALGFITAAIVYFQRQKKRKARYSQMAAHYHNGGLPPLVASTAGVDDKAQLSPNSTSSQSLYPKAQYENPTQFGVYGNLPSVPYTNVTDVTDYTETPPLSPQTRHSQYSNTGSTFEPYNPVPLVRHSIVYARPLSTPTQTDRPTSSIHGTPIHHGGALPNAQTSATQPGSLSSPTHGAHSFYGGGQITALTYNSPPRRPEYAEASGAAQDPVYSGGPHKEPEHVEASGSVHALAYTGDPHSANDFSAKGPEYAETPTYSGGPYGVNGYPRGKDQEYTVPSAGKQ